MPRLIRFMSLQTVALACIVLSTFLLPTLAQESSGKAWLAGDHHIHSRYSVGWNREIDPPAPIIGGDAIYPIQMNALMAKYFGLSWMVSTDHGGPGHSKVNRERAYPELLQSRLAVPEVIQFYGMELDTPGADHSSLIIPFSDTEAEQLFAIESDWAKREPWPANPEWDTEPRMLLALAAMAQQQLPPLIIANHPSRSATDLAEYGLDHPDELRKWNDIAPRVAVGMAGAPGHQAATLNADGSAKLEGARGGYGRYPTLGGFDQLSATVGGFWDAMIGEGRDWWITANSDSHVHFSEGGSDFWPGEYSKTYVWADSDHASILEAIRSGRIFVTTGDLISGIKLSLTGAGSAKELFPGDRVVVEQGQELQLQVTLNLSGRPNFNGDNPELRRVDIIQGLLFSAENPATDNSNASTRVIDRIEPDQWQQQGDRISFDIRIPRVEAGMYLRLRGTSGSELEPQPDLRGETPWQDLWFYTNPVRFVTN